MKEITSEQRSYIEMILKNYPEWKEEYDNAYEQIISASPSRDGLPAGGGSAKGSKQETLVVTMESRHFQFLRKNIDAVEKVMNQIPAEQRRIIRLRYFGMKKTPYHRVARICYISERTARYTVTRVLILIGRELGVIDLKGGK